MTPRILLFRGRGLVSALIRWQTRSRWSHAAILLPDGCTCIEAMQGAGVRLRVIANWAGIDVFEIPGMTTDAWQLAVAAASAELGKGYDWWAIIRFIDRARMPDNDRWFCSELVFAALQKAGINLLSRIEPWAVSPGLLAISTRLQPTTRL